MSRYHYIIFALVLSLSLTACIKRTQQEQLDTQCDRLINETVAAHNAYKKSLNQMLSEKVLNLIKAAKIDQQHAMFAGCVDKISRAEKLIGKKAPARKPKKN